MPKTADIIIIGGGVIGAALAWHLSARKAGQVVVLEKSYPGAGSSGKSGAIIRQHYSLPLTVRMSRSGLKFFEEFEIIVGGPPVFTRTGMGIVVKEKDRASLEANIQMQAELGVDCKIVMAQELMELDPHVRIAEDEIGAWEPEAGYVESVQAVSSFVDAARRNGAEIVSGVEVKDIQVGSGKVCGVETTGGSYESRCIVLATGAWAARLGGKLTIDLPVQACRTQVALFRRPADFAGSPVTYGDFINGTYFKGTHGNMLHVGSIRGEEINDPVDPDNYNEAVNADWLPMIRGELCKRYPEMEQSFGRGGYGALYGITPDWHPILDRLPGVEGAYCAVGFSGHGFKLSPIVGQLMTELIIDGRASSMDISMLRYARFAENDLVKTPYEYGIIG